MNHGREQGLWWFKVCPTPLSLPSNHRSLLLCLKILKNVFINVMASLNFLYLLISKVDFSTLRPLFWAPSSAATTFLTQNYRKWLFWGLQLLDFLLLEVDEPSRLTGAPETTYKACGGWSLVFAARPYPWPSSYYSSALRRWRLTVVAH